MQAVSPAGSSPQSNEASAGSSSSGVPSQPTLTGSVVPGSPPSVQLDWTPGTGGGAVDKWVILRDNVRLTTITTPSTTTYTDTTVVSGTTYTYKVRGVNAVGGGPNSNAVTLTP